MSACVCPLGQRLTVLCNPTNTVSFSKEASKEALRLTFYSLEAVTESLNWSMPLGSDALMEEEVQNRVKDVLWEADRVCFECNTKLQWDGTEDLQSTGTLSVRRGTCHKCHIWPLEQFHSDRLWARQNIEWQDKVSSSKHLECSLCMSVDIILAAPLYWTGCVCRTPRWALNSKLRWESTSWGGRRSVSRVPTIHPSSARPPGSLARSCKGRACCLWAKASGWLCLQKAGPQTMTD